MRKVIIMRGLPGCGKSHWVRNFLIGYKTSICVVSADSYHYTEQPPNPDGTLVPPKYEFKQVNARRAHDLCYIDFIAAIREGWQVIIVDNTNLTAWEIAPYLRYAEVMGLEVEIVWLRVPVPKCIARGVHGVPEATYAKMADRLEKEVLPPWWKQTIYHESENGCLVKYEPLAVENKT